MDERQVRIRIQSAVYDYANKLDWQPAPNQPETPLQRIESYGQRGIQTASEGFVMTLTDGSEYQITVVKSKLADSEK